MMSIDRFTRKRLVRLVVLVALVVQVLLPTLSTEASAGEQAGQEIASKGLRPRLGSAPESVENDQIPLDEFIEEQLAAAHMPGLSAVIVKRGQVVWSGAYGYSRVRTLRPITEDTLFQLASVSKTIIATAVGQLWEQGLLDLDADVNQYLPFRVENPHFPGVAITTRMLAAHNSSILDVGPLYLKGCGRGDPRMPLGEYVRACLVPGGKYHVPSLSYSRAEPGTAYNYSNTGATLAAYIVEMISGMPYEEYCVIHIFEPLGMNETSLRYADLDASRIAMPYRYLDGTGGYMPYGMYGCPDFPAGGMITSAPQLARHLIAFMQYGEYDGVRILQPDTVAEMRRIQFPDVESSFGLFWYYDALGDWILLGHNGGNYGVATEMFFDPETDTGVILLMNGDWSSDGYTAVVSIEDRLFREADNY